MVFHRFVVVFMIHFSCRSQKLGSRQNQYLPSTNIIFGEIWKNVPNTDFAYYSTHGRFSSSKDVGFPGNGCILCTEEELKQEVNEWADPDKSGKDFFTLWMDQAKESEKESEQE